MPYRNSDFKPTVETTNSARLIDPNPNGVIVPIEDMFIFMSLVARQKSKSVITELETNAVVENLYKNDVELVSPQTTTEIKGNKLFTTKDSLTTDWTEIGGFKKAEDKLYLDFEGFGITNVDVEIKSQTNPIITIDFVDIRGATLFEQGSCSPYGLFFNLPYPIFELTLKGYYGRPVKYYLNMTKFTSKFNSDTGNMECRGTFLGYSFAFLSDMIMGWVSASQYLKQSDYDPQSKLRDKYTETAKFYGLDNNPSVGELGNVGVVDIPWCNNDVSGEGRCTTINDLIKNLHTFENQDKTTIVNSPEYNEVTELLLLNKDLETYRKILEGIVERIKLDGEVATSTAYEGGVTLKQRIIFNNEETLVKLLEKGGALYGAFNQKDGQLIKAIKTLKTRKVTEKTNGDTYFGDKGLLTSYTAEDFLRIESDTTLPFEKIYDQLNESQWQTCFNGTYPDLAYKKGDKQEPTTKTCKSGYFLSANTSLCYSGTTTNPGVFIDTIEVDNQNGKPYLDFGYIFKNIEETQKKLTGDKSSTSNAGIITDKKAELTKAINEIIADRIGFKPTIRNIFTVLLCNTDAFMEIMLNVYANAEKYHDDINYGNVVIPGGEKEILPAGKQAYGDGKPKVFPWPTYFKKDFTLSSRQQGTKEAYPGKDYPSWFECKFVEDMITAYMDYAKDVEIILGNTEGKAGYDNYVPINPLESGLWNTENPIKYYDIQSPDEAVTIVGERLFINLDHTLMSPIRMTPDMNLMPLYNGDNWSMIPNTDTNEGSTAYQLGRLDAFNFLNTQDGDSGQKMLSGFDSLITSKPEDFYEIVKKSLQKEYTSLNGGTTAGSWDEKKASDSGIWDGYPQQTLQLLSPGGVKQIGFTSSDEYYIFKPVDGSGEEGLKLNNTKGSTVTILPNPHKMDVKDVFKILPENIDPSGSMDGGDYRKINIDEDLKKEVEEYQTFLTKKTTAISFGTQAFKVDKDNRSDIIKATLDTTYGTTFFGDPRLFITLAMSDALKKEETEWFKGSGNLNELKVSNMGLLTYWDRSGFNEVHGISFLTDDTNQNDIFVGSPTYPIGNNPLFIDRDDWSELESETENIFSGTDPKNIQPNDDVFMDSTDTISGDGIATPLITTPLWLDNVNKFRISAGHGWLKTKSGGDDLDGKLERRNLAYLFLHSIKTTPLISRYITDDGYLLGDSTSFISDGETLSTGGDVDTKSVSFIQSLRAFMVTGGVAKVPKSWLLTVGSELWRWKSFVGVNTDGSWVKPLTCKNCKRGDTPNGYDPLAQPGFNFNGGSVYQQRNSLKTNIAKHTDINNVVYPAGIEQYDRNNLPLYLNTIYGVNTTFARSNIQRSSFSNVYQRRKKGQVLNSDGNTVITNGVFSSFRYYNIYKDRVGKLSPILLDKDSVDNGYGSNVKISEQSESHVYSWAQLWIAPHHIPYVNPEIFYDTEGEGSSNVLIFDNMVDYQDYQTIQPETYDGFNYHDGTNITKSTSQTTFPAANSSTNRDKKSDGNLGMILQYLPDKVKDMFIEEFEKFCDSEWTGLLATIDPVNFSSRLLTSTYAYSSDICASQLGSKAWALSLKDDASIRKNLLTDQKWLLNSTPKIWYGVGDNTQKPITPTGSTKNEFLDKFVVSKVQFEAYLKGFHTAFKEKRDTQSAKITEKQVQGDGNVLGSGIIDDDDVKLSLYRTFKSTSDKWISGSNMGVPNKLFFNLLGGEGGSDGSTCNAKAGRAKPTLASHFQYVNRVMGDIGDLAVIDITKLNELLTNPKISLYQYLSDLLIENEYLFFPLPAYIDFTAHGAKEDDLVDMFRPVNNLKKASCGPLFLSMYVGGSSRQLNFNTTPNCPIDAAVLNNLSDDSWSLTGLGQPSEFNTTDATLSEGFTAFKVVYGLDTQNHFKNIQLDQSEFSETAESLAVIDKLANQNGGNQSSKGQNLNAAYLTRSYTCDIETIGNMMIQPMTYFELIGVPMFSGTYLITSVKHNFKPNNSVTNFKGVRQPRMTVPIVTDVAVAMNLSFKDIKSTGIGKSITSIERGGGSGGSVVLARVAKQPGGKGAANVPNGKFDRTKVDDYGTTYGILDKTDDGTLFKPNQPITKPIGNMVNSAYANINVSTRTIPGTDGGNLGCASAVSIIFYRATGYALVGESYITLGTMGIFGHLDSEADKANSSWQRIKNWREESKPGDIICTSRNGSVAGHVGVIADTTNKDGSLDIISNSSAGFLGDRLGQIELNFSVKKWESVAKRNPEKTFSFRYIGPYATTWPAPPVSSTKKTTPITEEQKNANELITKNFFKTKGLSKIQAAGAMGNIQQESGFNPGALNAEDENRQYSFGLIQWNAATVTKEIVGDTLEKQLNYLVNPSNSVLKSRWTNYIKITSNGTDATKEKLTLDTNYCAWKFAEIVEICKNCNKGYTKYKTDKDQTKRSNYAIKFFNRFNDSNDPLYWA